MFIILNLTPFTPYGALCAHFGRQGCGLNPTEIVAHEYLYNVEYIVSIYIFFRLIRFVDSFYV